MKIKPIESEKKFKKPTAWQREFHNVAKIARFTRVKISSKSKNATICSTPVVEFHMHDGGIEEQPAMAACAVIPKDILPQILKALKEVTK